MRAAAFPPRPVPGYALLDSGRGEKLERVGDWTLVRPDPQALWRRRLPGEDWKGADLVFVRESDRGGRFEARGRPAPRDGWVLDLEELRLRIRPTAFKHVGLFPEQAPNWDWMRARLEEAGPEPRLLNLFAYTGVASLLARRAGAQVTHVDASKQALTWARENAELSGLSDGIRWMLEDASVFVRREARRGARYHGILLDPPHYGRGPKGEKWQLERDLAPLLEACRELLEERAFVVLSSYAVGYTATSLANLLADLGPGAIEAGELVLVEEGDGGRPLPCGLAARWSRGG